VNVEKEREFFDAFEADHGDYDVLAEESYRRILTVFARATRTPPAATCVDLGCGTGAFTRRLSALGLDLTGVDISPRSIERANVLGGGRFVVGDIMNCSLTSASYDCTVMSGVLHHVPTRAERVRSLREAFRVLKRGGRFFSYDPNAHSPSMWLYRHPASPFYSSAGKTENEILLSRRQLTSELTEAGFSDVRVRGLSGIAYRYVEGPLAQRMLPLYNRVYEPLIRWCGFERYLGTFLIATATKGQTVPAGSLH
jgi:SAM-dependent methyltransferase